ncbi:hypothetical protein BJ508DRAFT_322091 [Ascobolus immersus RN42]|uniref:Uncharacterized protein n=1 Tax=Ascobolus immersus RN42 TaxID=1160509 RepID=A0A3N4IIH5_ASCIM|nr:hypothetical protein BJ508DRAFT_322091 [Ascobolus immersus RN42]
MGAASSPLGYVLTEELFKLMIVAAFATAFSGFLRVEEFTYEAKDLRPDFRWGAATTASLNRIPEEHIQTMGRWKSSAYKLYIDTPGWQLHPLSRQLHWHGSLDPLSGLPSILAADGSLVASAQAFTAWAKIFPSLPAYNLPLASSSSLQLTPQR